MAYECIVIGAGIQGSLTAYHLAKNNKKTLLLEQVGYICRKRYKHTVSVAAELSLLQSYLHYKICYYAVGVSLIELGALHLCSSLIESVC